MNNNMEKQALEENEDLLINEARKAMDTGDWRAAVNICASLRQEFQEQPFGYEGGIKAFLKTGQPAEAERLCLEGIKKWPHNFSIWLQYADIVYKYSNPRQALDSLNAFIKQFPDRPEGYIKYIDESWRSMGCDLNTYYPLARNISREAIKTFPENLTIWEKSIITAAKAGDYNSAFVFLSEFHKKFPDSPYFYKQTVIILCHLWDFKGAEDCCSEWASTFPHSPEPLIAYAEIALKKLDYKKAAECLSYARLKFPMAMEVYRQGVKVLRLLGDFAQAEILCREWMAKISDNLEPKHAYAELAWQKRDFFSAIARCNCIFEHTPPHLLANYEGISRIYALYAHCTTYMSRERINIEQLAGAYKNDERLNFVMNINKVSTFSQRKKMIISTIRDDMSIRVGFSDFLRGCLSLYGIAKKLGVEYRIYWNRGFDLETFLKPNLYDWRIAASDIISDKQFSLVLRLDMYAKKSIDDLIDTVKSSDYFQYHIYTNRPYETNVYHFLFNELFTLQPTFAEEINTYIAKLGNYISITFRFMNLLGDFDEIFSRGKQVLDVEAQNVIIKKCAHEISSILKNLPKDYNIFVSSDSAKFLEHISQYDRVYAITGKRYHLSVHGGQNANDLHKKSLLDFFLIMNAKKTYRFSTGNMYKTAFPWLAATCADRECTDHVF